MRCEFLIFFFSFFGGIGKNFNLDFVENRSKIFHTMEIIILEGRCNRFFFFPFCDSSLPLDGNSRRENFHQFSKKKKE